MTYTVPATVLTAAALAGGLILINKNPGNDGNPPLPPPDCHPSYSGKCLDPDASDYDCAGGSGNGPRYTGTVRVVGPDVFDLDRDGDGLGCE